MGAQRSLREYFGVPKPAAEHRAMEDVGVLSAIVQPLLAASAAPSLQHLMATTMSNGVAGTYAGLVAQVLRGKDQGSLPQGLLLHHYVASAGEQQCCFIQRSMRLR